MANHDGSMASQVEDWIVTQLQAILFNAVPAFEAADVLPWEGTDAETLSGFAEELMSASRNKIARVFFLNDRMIELSDDQIQAVPTYVILIGIKNYTPAVVRRGDERSGVKDWGTNVMRDLLKAKFNQQLPNLNDGVTYTDRSHYLGSEITFHAKNVCIMRAEVTVDESPKAT